MKGRLALTFWLVVVLAVLLSTSSYAWLAINIAARLGGFEVELESDSLYLEISDDVSDEYGTKVSFDRATFSLRGGSSTHEIFLVSYGLVPDDGAILIDRTQVDQSDAKYDGTGRFYLPSDSEIGEGKYNYTDVTDKLKLGDSLVGYYEITERVTHEKAQTDEEFYYVKTVRTGGNADYSCLGTFDVGENLAGRKYWGYANSTKLESAEPDNIMNVVSMDTPTDDYCLKRTVYLRGASGTADARDLKIASVEIDGRKNYLTNAIRIMFVATSDRGRSTAVIYNHRNPGSFDGTLFEEIFGDERETVTVDMYIYFDGKDEAAHNSTDFLTSHTVSVHFTVDDHVYNQ